MPAYIAHRRIIFTGLALSAALTFYFWMLDRVVFLSTADFAPIFRYLLTRCDSQTAWLSAAVVLSAAAWKSPTPILRLVDFLARSPVKVAVAAGILVAVGSAFIYRDCALSMDEYAAVFQSKIFAAGHIWTRLPASVVDWLVIPGFNGSFLIASHADGRAIEGYWPGFALLLAPFQWLGAPWLCNASLAALAIYLVYAITHHIVGNHRAAGWALLFTLSSGAFAANAISFYSMQAHLTLNLLFAGLLMETTRLRASAAGLVGSLALILHNPLPHTLFAIPWLAWMAIDKMQRRYLPYVILGYLPGIALALGWLLLRSNIVPTAHTLSAISGVGNGVFVLPDRALFAMRAASIAKMWIWAVPCLFLVALSGFSIHRDKTPVRLLAMSATTTFVAYFFVKLDQGHGWGFRYFHSAWGVIPILAGCAMTGDTKPESQSRYVSFVGALSILAVLVIVPFQLNQIGGFISRHLAQIEPPSRPGDNVYFIQPGGGFYMADLVQMDPFLRNRDLLLASRGESLDAELVRQNWPHAIKAPAGFGSQRWYLGGADQPESAVVSAACRHCALAFHRATP